MRILSGEAKNRLLKTPKGDKTRPTASKVRKSLFDILQYRVEDSRFLDLFAGSGAMGIEALSRGALSATFVEKDRQAANCIAENLESCGFSDRGTIFSLPVEKGLPLIQRKEKPFDLIFVDPPYDLPIASLLDQIAPLLSAEGLLIVEQRKGATLSCQGLEETDCRSFGETLLFFFKKFPV